MHIHLSVEGRGFYPKLIFVIANGKKIHLQSQHILHSKLMSLRPVQYKLGTLHWS